MSEEIDNSNNDFIARGKQKRENECTIHFRHLPLINKVQQLQIYIKWSKVFDKKKTTLTSTLTKDRVVKLF